jgi:hypothetical protein
MYSDESDLVETMESLFEATEARVVTAYKVVISSWRDAFCLYYIILLNMLMMSVSLPSSCGPGDQMYTQHQFCLDQEETTEGALGRMHLLM